MPGQQNETIALLQLVLYSGMDCLEKINKSTMIWHERQRAYIIKCTRDGQPGIIMPSTKRKRRRRGTKVSMEVSLFILLMLPQDYYCVSILFFVVVVLSV